MSQLLDCFDVGVVDEPLTVVLQPDRLIVQTLGVVLRSPPIEKESHRSNDCSKDTTNHQTVVSVDLGAFEHTYRAIRVERT